MSTVFEQPETPPCDCCDDRVDDERQPWNAPRQSALKYRIGTYNSFLQRMIARLSEDQVPEAEPALQRPLGRLTSRTTDDPMVALLDAWAVTADVLTFYQERIANEGFLRTASERFSVLQLARSIGYELSPGLAAGTYLTFDAETAPGSPVEVRVLKGTRVLSIPGQDEKPQTFETVESIVARPEWNAISPDRSLVDSVSPFITDPGTPNKQRGVYLQGLANGITVGATLLLHFDGGWHATTVTEVEPIAAERVTRIHWSEAVNVGSEAETPGLWVFRDRASLLGHNAPVLSLAPLETVVRAVSAHFESRTKTAVSSKQGFLLAFDSPTSGQLWAASSDAGTWARTRRLNFPAGFAEPAAGAVDDNGSTVALGTVDGKVAVVSPTRARSLQTALGKLERLAFSESGSYLLASSKDCMGVWSASDLGEVSADFKARTRVGSPGGYYLVVREAGGVSLFSYSKTPPRWEEKLLLRSLAVQLAVLSEEVVEEEQSVVVVSAATADGRLYRVTSADAAPQHIGLHNGGVATLLLSGDGTKMISVGLDGRTILWEPGKPFDQTVWPADPLTNFEDWPVRQEEDKSLTLDAAYPAVVPTSRVLLRLPSQPDRHFAVVDTNVTFATQPGVSAKVTRIDLEGSGQTDLSQQERRDAVVYLQSEALALRQLALPREAPVMGERLTLAALFPHLPANRTLVLTGKPMRAQLHENCPVQILRASDGFNTVEVAPGDTLEVLSAPRAISTSPTAPKTRLTWEKDTRGFLPALEFEGGSETSEFTIRWHLRDRNGFEGYLETEVPSVNQKCAVYATHAQEDDRTVSEVATLEMSFELLGDDGVRRTQVRLGRPLQNLFDRTTLKINANVAKATHGETIPLEVLGGGVGSATNQTFILQKNDLTYTAAPTPSGGESNLEVRVNDVKWDEARSLFGLTERDRAYMIRHNDDGTARIIFGDGTRGARLPSGLENVTARYRAGLGPEGEVRTNTLKLLQVKPLGIREVTNPVPASGAAPPERLQEARTNAPLKVLTLDRVVSIKDFEDFAAAFSGVGKARADGFRVGENRFVYLTVASASGLAVGPESNLIENLINALNRIRDTTLQVRVGTFVPKFFRICADTEIDTPTYIEENVLEQIRQRLREAFAFEARGFAQDVLPSEILKVVHQVPGVVAVRITGLLQDKPGARMHPACVSNTQSISGPASQPDPLVAKPPRLVGDQVEYAELLLLSPADDAIEFKVKEFAP